MVRLPDLVAGPRRKHRAGNCGNLDGPFRHQQPNCPYYSYAFIHPGLVRCLVGIALLPGLSFYRESFLGSAIGRVLWFDAPDLNILIVALFILLPQILAALAYFSLFFA